jgi:hypothetical protein
MTDADAQDHLPPIAISVPGQWETLESAARQIAARSGGYLFTGDALTNIATGRAWACDVIGPDKSLHKTYERAGQGRMPKAELAMLRKHTLTLRLYGPGGSYEAARNMMTLAAALLRAGGIAVKVDSSGIAHGREDFLALHADVEPGGVYWTYVSLINSSEGFHTCGMHALGHRDVITSDEADPRQAWLLMHQFNGYSTQSGMIIADGDAVGDEQGVLFHAYQESCTLYPRSSLYYNPYGMWRLKKIAAS